MWTKKLPALHTGADWKVVLNLPEIEKWLKTTSNRVAQLTYSVGQDSENKHVDVHLVQLKDICEDISDHVEEIHALLETEFSLKHLSYSGNIIVDIRTVQLLWHQLRVSVLVLKERLLQGLQDSNGNYTRQTDILQALSQDQHQTRLDALTEVDDCGQLTIRCSENYFSLDCGITAFELSDYSPSNSPKDQEMDPTTEDTFLEITDTTNTNLEIQTSLPQLSGTNDLENANNYTPLFPANQSEIPNNSESSKQTVQAVNQSTESLPTHSLLPKSAAVFSSNDTRSMGSFRKANQESELKFDAELSRSSPSVLDPLDRSKLWLELGSVHPENAPQSSKTLQGKKVPSKTNLAKEHWFGSDEFLALPAQLHETELLAVKLESLIQSSAQGQISLQNIDDWELSELNVDWNNGESEINIKNAPERGDNNQYPLPSLQPYKQHSVRCFSSTSSSDIAPSVEESIESGPLSELLSEEEERSVDYSPQLRVPLLAGCGCASSMMKKLLKNIQDRNGDVWRKMESFVMKLDGFISWLQEALESTENWTQPRQDLDTLRVYLDTHLNFKINVEIRKALKDTIMEEGNALLGTIPSHQFALEDILHMVESQWDQLQRQIRRQHSWMLRAFHFIQARLLHTRHTQEPFTAMLDMSAKRQLPCFSEEMEKTSTQSDIQENTLKTMSVKLGNLCCPSSSRRVRDNIITCSQDFEAEYQELWDWLMDMDAMVTDSHQLMMSEEQRQYLFKSCLTEMLMMENWKTSLLRQAANLKRSGSVQPSNLHIKMHNLTQTWQQLEKILSENLVPYSSDQKQSSNTLLVSGRDVAAEGPHSVLSPMTNSLLEQLEARIKELKTWLRETELLIFSSCLKQEKDASEQLPNFKSLCSEIQMRRRGVASVLKLCQKMLQQSQLSLVAETGPETERHREALQLMSINLERRWEAIVMQALQWQNRLKRELGEQVNGNILEKGLVELNKITPVSLDSVAGAPDDSWEWDEIDMTVMEAEQQDVLQPDLTTNLPITVQSNLPSDTQSNEIELDIQETEQKKMSSMEVQHRVNSDSPPKNNIYQVYSLHNIELCNQPTFSPTSTLRYINESLTNKEHVLLKSMSKDSLLSSNETLPDLLGGLMKNSQQQKGVSEVWNNESESGRRSEKSENILGSDCESGIVSDNGDSETSTHSGIQGTKLDKDVEKQEKRDLGKVDENQEHYSYKRSKMGISNNLEEWKMKEVRWEPQGNRQEEEKKGCKDVEGEAVEIVINGQGILAPANSDSDLDVKELDGSFKIFMTSGDKSEFDSYHYNSFATPQSINGILSPVLSQSSSFESLLTLGIELFPSKERLHQSTSLESFLNQCNSPDKVVAGNVTSPSLLNQGQEKHNNKAGSRGDIHIVTETSGDLSQKTLDLLKRLEDIQNPLVGKMTRSVSDMSIQSCTPQNNQLPTSPSLGCQNTPLSGILSTSWKDERMLMNETLSKVSLNEVSSTKDSSLESEDFVRLRNQYHRFLDPSMAASVTSSSRMKHCNNSKRGGKGVDESDAASLSMVVNISCTSAGTDEDDSDLLSSSTLTLSEEELGVRKEQDGCDKRVNGVFTGNEDEEDNDEDDMDTSYELGLEYMKTELQRWIHSPCTFASSSVKVEAGLLDELQCGSSPSSTFTCSRSQLTETNSQDGNNTSRKAHKNKVNVRKSYISQFADDVENGNIDHNCLHVKDEDDDLLQEESGLFTKKRHTVKELYMNTKSEEPVQDGGDLRAENDSSLTRYICSSPTRDHHPLSSKHASCLVGELRGELPCHSTSLPSPPFQPTADGRSHSSIDKSLSNAGRKAITIQEKFKFSSLVTEETRREVRAKDSSLTLKKGNESHLSCCSPSVLSTHPQSRNECKGENAHHFVTEIIDKASIALKNKKNKSDGENPRETTGSIKDQSSTSLTHIRDKVLQQCHRPLHLRNGDFYSYLSLSSHDSDCGEVSQCGEETSLTPVPYSLESCFKLTQDLNNLRPKLSTTQPANSIQSALLTKSSSPYLTPRNNVGLLDLKCFDGETCSGPGESQAEQSNSPSFSVPSSPDLRNEEMLFKACTEEVYLGPPLCYSILMKNKSLPFQHTVCLDTSSDSGYELTENPICLSQIEPNSEGDNRLTDSSLTKQDYGCTKKTEKICPPVSEPYNRSFSNSLLLKGNSSFSGDNLSSPEPVSTIAKEEKLGEDLYLSSDGVAGRVFTAANVGMPQEERSCNEGSSYLNPWMRVALIDSFTTECLGDTKTLESNMGTIMTKISVSSSATNPSKNPATAATRINPKINCLVMRKPDREEKSGKKADTQWAEEEKRRRGWSSAQQEAKSTMVKKVCVWPVVSQAVGATLDEANQQRSLPRRLLDNSSSTC
ncbi:A-kinase anchor protein 6 isoform X2 [Cyprinodon tularosa]|uniref:A-kinase anchor protein 6 isoform X2 n=1 Tax=Cyprinodon tularosa TaxID=77115 RepID=UPI0018E1DA8B|nr:A-kinase anchor protein 6 isoform X2 [Cyprinodon tularosa]